ncbi:MAG: hypothetical protein ACRCWF_04675 [Beijerinckiaceae bacterium]
MYDAVILADANPTASARTLATLVEGVVEGMLGRVVVLASAENDAFAKLTDAAGCSLVIAETGAQIPGALKDHLSTSHVLAFKAGAILPPGWPALLKAEIHKHGHPYPEGAFAFRPPTRKTFLTMAFSITVRQKMTLVHGGLVPRSWLLDETFAGDTLKPPGPVHMTKIIVVENNEI